ncbi:S-layer homology domain-containing protein [Alkalicoccus urumqiensis]|uniref:SLH domain-containing protein n=1 Tax=Alkalicoccus urumqiensis TaxID=1548213 RepID=A0A2P6MHQ0_ALKUR|nr:S-layer homology domain-containing protein [Alkalicoccus urumqiensis]PRO65825.1 hypothetical protein C6I21_07970 [Alkalicoccus urumqiensis]
MRKYPLSKKATATALAVTMALTPFTAFNPAADGEAATVHAAEYEEVDYDTIEDVIDAAMEVYEEFLQNLDTDAEAELAQIGTNIVNYQTDNDWSNLLDETLVAELNEESGQSGDFVEDVLQDLIIIIHEASNQNSEQVEAQMENFANNDRYQEGIANIINSRTDSTVTISDIASMISYLQNELAENPPTANDNPKEYIQNLLEGNETYAAMKEAWNSYENADFDEAVSSFSNVLFADVDQNELFLLFADAARYVLETPEEEKDDQDSGDDSGSDDGSDDSDQESDDEEEDDSDDGDSGVVTPPPSSGDDDDEDEDVEEEDPSDEDDDTDSDDEDDVLDEDESEVDETEDEVTVGSEDVEVERVANEETGEVTNRVRVNEERLEETLNRATAVESVVFNVDTEEGVQSEVTIPTRAVDSIARRNPDAKIVVNTQAGSYNVPVSQINDGAVRRALGFNEDDEIEVDLRINRSEDTGGVTERNNLNRRSDVVEFKVRVRSGESTTELNNFSSWIERGINLQTEEDETLENLVAVRLNDDGTFTPVSTKTDGNRVTFRSYNNSKYTVVENAVSFSDVPAAIWYEGPVTKLASQYIFEGFPNGEFRPGEHTTRAEFAAVLTRGLGLNSGESYSNEFTDVTGSEWFSDELMAVLNYRLVGGYPNNEFRPNETITRQEASVMIQRAMDLVGVEFESDADRSYLDYADSDDVAPYARGSVNIATRSGLMEGRPNNQFAPRDNITRAEITALLDRFLQKSDFIN